MLVSMVCWALAPALAVPEAVGKPWSVEEVHGGISTLWGMVNPKSNGQYEIIAQ